MPAPNHRYFKISWSSIFYNPFFLTRRGLYKGILRNRHFLQGRMLDFGCGNKPYAALLPNVEYIGLDFDTEVSRQNIQQTVDFFYDGKTFPFPENHFDSAFSSEVLEHVFNPDEILRELYRVLKPGGHLLLTCPFFWPEHEQPYDYARYSSFGLKHLMEKAGFEAVQYEKAGSYFESLLQGFILYLYFFIPHRPRVLEVLFFSVFITPFLVVGLLLAAILPARVKRSDLYLNNIIVVRKPL